MVETITKQEISAQVSRTCLAALAPESRELILPICKPYHKTIRSLLGYQHNNKRLAGGELGGKLAPLFGSTDGRASGLPIPPGRKNAHLIHFAFLERCEKYSSGGIRTATVAIAGVK